MSTVYQNIFFLSLAAFGLVLGLLFLLSKFASKIGLIDFPGPRKPHLNPTPMVGGIAILLSLLALDYFFEIWNVEHRFIARIMLVVVLIGVLDDFYSLNARFKFTLQLLVASIVVLMGGLLVTNLGDIIGTGFIFVPIYLQPVFTIVALVGLMNAMNMIDGIDGLAAGLALVSFLGFSVISVLINDFDHLKISVIVFSALFGFFVLNFRFKNDRPAKVYLGDAGAILIGFCLTTLAIHLSSKVLNPVDAIIPVWIVAVPLMDMASLMWFRARRRISVMTSGMDHLHHTLQNLGYSVRQVVLIMMALQALFVTIGILGVFFEIPSYMMFYGFLFTLIIYSIAVKKLQSMANEHPKPVLM